MRTFLQATLNLIKNSKKESCNDIRNNVNSGIATYLSLKYKEYFEDIPKYKIEETDKFFKDYVEDFENYERKHDCNGNEGLYLILSVAFNKLY